MELSIELAACKYLFESKTPIWWKNTDDSIWWLNFIVSTSRASHRIPVWLVQGMKLFYTEARTHLKRSNMRCSVGFSGHKKHGDDSTVFCQFIWELGVPGCFTSWSVQTPGRSIDIKFQCLPKGLVYQNLHVRLQSLCLCLPALRSRWKSWRGKLQKFTRNWTNTPTKRFC